MILLYKENYSHTHMLINEKQVQTSHANKQDGELS